MIRRSLAGSQGAFERCEGHAAEDDKLARLVAVVGADRFRKVQDLFGGQRVWIPKPGSERPCKRCPERDRKIATLRREGWNVTLLAERFGLSSKRVYAIIEELAHPGKTSTPKN